MCIYWQIRLTAIFRKVFWVWSVINRIYTRHRICFCAVRRCRIVESCTVSLVGMDPGKYCSGRISAVPGLLSYCGCDVPVQCSGFIMHHACCLLYPFVCHQQKGAPAGEVVCLSAIHLPADSGRNPVCRICRSELSSDRLIGHTGIIRFRRMPAAWEIPSSSLPRTGEKVPLPNNKRCGSCIPSV